MGAEPGKCLCQSNSSVVLHICHKIQIQTYILLPRWRLCQHILLINELEVFSYALANRSSAKLWIQICISKYDDSSHQSPNAVTVWQCPPPLFRRQEGTEKILLLSRGLFLFSKISAAPLRVISIQTLSLNVEFKAVCMYNYSITSH